MSDHITKTSQLPTPAIGPRHAHLLGVAVEAGAKIATIKVLIELLKTHSDPMVKNAASVIEDTCVEPWIEGLAPEVENSFDVSQVDRYDLVLPADGDAFIGSDDKCAVQITLDHVSRRHAKVTHREDNGDHTWVVSLEKPIQRGTRVGLKVGDEEISRSALDREFGDGPTLQVKPGDTIEIGLNKITLHFPTEPYKKQDAE
jgi:hypothetical protein